MENPNNKRLIRVPARATYEAPLQNPSDL